MKKICWIYATIKREMRSSTFTWHKLQIITTVVDLIVWKNKKNNFTVSQ